MLVIKRSGKVVDYNSSKVKDAIAAAMTEVEGFVDNDCITEIEEVVWWNVKEYSILDVEEIQDIIERELMPKYPAIAKAYILYRAKQEEKRNKPWSMNELQRKIFNDKYRHDGEDFNDFIDRVSGYDEEVGKLIRNQEFVFAGRILAGRGIDRNVSLSNCYVLPAPEDNLESIFGVASKMARTYSYGGGVGIDLSNLRPEGADVNNAALTTSGPVSFMELYDTTTSVIGQKGRRGALMLSMEASHQDIKTFINSKSDVDKINHANISVRARGELFNKDTDVLELIAKNNWETGEPGMLFWDRVESWHLLEHDINYRMVATNPCGEQPLPAYGSCLLGSINLAKFVDNPFTDEAAIDHERLAKVAKVAVRAMNDVLDEGIDQHPLQEQRDQARNYRQIGVGVMGLADMLVMLGVEYGSPTAVKISEVLGEIIRDSAYLASIELAKEHGPYPAFNADVVKQSSYFKALPVDVRDGILEHGMRNSHVLSIAPTGSISTLFGVSGGIEPIFANSYTRTTKSIGERDYQVFTKVIEDLMEVQGVQELPSYCVTSHEIVPSDRIKMQAAWQNVVDSAISSTVNLKESATVEDIIKIYREAYRAGLKGITVFRNNSLRVGILNSSDEVEEEECST